MALNYCEIEVLCTDAYPFGSVACPYCQHRSVFETAFGFAALNHATTCAHVVNAVYRKPKTYVIFKTATRSEEEETSRPETDPAQSALPTANTAEKAAS